MVQDLLIPLMQGPISQTRRHALLRSHSMTHLQLSFLLVSICLSEALAVYDSRVERQRSHFVSEWGKIFFSFF